ncbi:MAG: hypothetical protein ACQERE_07475 [Pseudomonadota bacterium]
MLPVPSSGSAGTRCAEAGFRTEAPSTHRNARATGQTLNHLEEAIAEAGSIEELDAAFETVQGLPETDTGDTERLRALRQTLANRYMREARERLDEQRLESAGPLLERATNLARQAQASP